MAFLVPSEAEPYRDGRALQGRAVDASCRHDKTARSRRSPRCTARSRRSPRCSPRCGPRCGTAQQLRERKWIEQPAEKPVVDRSSPEAGRRRGLRGGELADEASPQQQVGGRRGLRSGKLANVQAPAQIRLTLWSHICMADFGKQMRKRLPRAEPVDDDTFCPRRYPKRPNSGPKQINIRQRIQSSR